MVFINVEILEDLVAQSKYQNIDLATDILGLYSEVDSLYNDHNSEVFKMAIRENLYKVSSQPQWQRIVADLDLVNDIFA